MLSGLRSRCTIPRACAFASPLGNLEQVLEQNLEITVFPVHLVTQVSPSTNSIAINHAVGLADFIDVRDVWMVKRRGRFCFLSEATHAILIRGDIGGQNLDCYFAIQFRITSKIDLTHSARAKLRADFISAKSCARSNSQRDL